MLDVLSSSSAMQSQQVVGTRRECRWIVDEKRSRMGYTASTGIGKAPCALALRKRSEVVGKRSERE
jgi:hypothetical protein